MAEATDEERARALMEMIGHDGVIVTAYGSRFSDDPNELAPYVLRLLAEAFAAVRADEQRRIAASLRSFGATRTADHVERGLQSRTD